MQRTLVRLGHVLQTHTPLLAPLAQLVAAYVVSEHDPRLVLLGDAPTDAWRTTTAPLAAASAATSHDVVAGVVVGSAADQVLTGTRGRTIMASPFAAAVRDHTTAGGGGVPPPPPPLLVVDIHPHRMPRVVIPPRSAAFTARGRPRKAVRFAAVAVDDDGDTQATRRGVAAAGTTGGGGDGDDDDEDGDGAGYDDPADWRFATLLHVRHVRFEPTATATAATTTTTSSSVGAPAPLQWVARTHHYPPVPLSLPSMSHGQASGGRTTVVPLTEGRHAPALCVLRSGWGAILSAPQCGVTTTATAVDTPAPHVPLPLTSTGRVRDPIPPSPLTVGLSESAAMPPQPVVTAASSTALASRLRPPASAPWGVQPLPGLSAFAASYSDGRLAQWYDCGAVGAANGSDGERDELWFAAVAHSTSQASHYRYDLARDAVLPDLTYPVTSMVLALPGGDSAAAARARHTMNRLPSGRRDAASGLMDGQFVMCAQQCVWHPHPLAAPTATATKASDDAAPAGSRMVLLLTNSVSAVLGAVWFARALPTVFRPLPWPPPLAADGLRLVVATGGSSYSGGDAALWTLFTGEGRRVLFVAALCTAVLPPRRPPPPPAPKAAAVASRAGAAQDAMLNASTTTAPLGTGRSRVRWAAAPTVATAAATGADRLVIHGDDHSSSDDPNDSPPDNDDDVLLDGGDTAHVINAMRSRADAALAAAAALRRVCVYRLDGIADDDASDAHGGGAHWTLLPECNMPWPALAAVASAAASASSESSAAVAAQRARVGVPELRQCLVTAHF